jgi:hypothetical protein
LAADGGGISVWENGLVGDAGRVVADDGGIPELASRLRESDGGEESGGDD